MALLSDNGFYSLEIPIHWSMEYIAAINNLQNTFDSAAGKICSMYGALNNTGFYSGRIKLNHQSISYTQARDILDFSKASGFKFYYLLNAPLLHEIRQQEIISLEKIFNNLSIESVVVADLRLAKAIKHYFPHVEIQISTIADVSSPEELNVWDGLEIKQAVLPHDLPKKIKKLERLLSALQMKNITPVMMVTESCLFECPWRKEHYQTLGNGGDDAQYHSRCLAKRYQNAAEFFMSGSFVRPQDLRYYTEKFGITHFKLSGRSQCIKWKQHVVQAYLSGNYTGNLINLMGMDPLCLPDKRFFMDSCHLDNYIQRLISGEDNRKLGQEYADKFKVIYEKE